MTEWIARRAGREISAVLRDGALHLRVSHGTGTLLGAAALSLRTTAGTDLLAGLRYVREEHRIVEEDYELVVGKRIGPHAVTHAERSVDFRRPDGGGVTLVLRAADDGVAFRFVLRDVDGLTVTGSDLDFDLPVTAPIWPQNYTSWYEEPRFASTVGELPPGDYALPLLAHLDPDAVDAYVLIAEADVDGRYGGSYLNHTEGRFAFTLADSVRLGPEVATPWRVFHLGPLEKIVTSHLVEDLAPPSAAGVPAWVRPGRAAWSWWSDFYSGAQLATQLDLVDHAAEHGWEHLLVDCGWDRAWLPELVAAATARGVGVFVWISWDWLDIHRDLAEWAALGVAGIKVDFMESESQGRYRWYDEVIAEAERVGLMVNFHGSVIPRGWARTHPHVVTYEAVRGAEYYVFYGEPLPPQHHTILPFTRNVIGSADYTPVTFSAATRMTSEAHELALAVVIESGIIHFADRISEYTARPLAEAVLDLVAAAWDETRLLGGYPGEWVAIARRTGTDWLVGVVSAGPARSVELDLTALHPAGTRVIGDGMDGALAEHLAFGATVRLDLVENGGAVLVPVGATPRNVSAPAPAPVPGRTLIFADAGETVTVRATDLGGAPTLLHAPPGWPTPVPTGPGAWDVTVPAGAGPAHVAVLGLRAADPTKRSAVSHVRIATHPGPGTTDLTTVSPLAVTNGFGPVERDTSNGGGDPRDGRTMTVAGVEYPRGLGVSAPSEIVFALGGRAERFRAEVGIDDEAPRSGATVEVRADGEPLFRTELAPGTPAVPIDVDVRGRHLLSLHVVADSPAEPDLQPHVDWIAPRLHRNP